LHRCFVKAVNESGVDTAAPKQIMKRMQVEGLTRENVASHLQKYRAYLKHRSTGQPDKSKMAIVDDKAREGASDEEVDDEGNALPPPAKSHQEEEEEDEDEEDEEEEEEDDDGSSFCLAFERHESLVTPRVALDGSLGCHPPRTQDLIVLYRAAGGELTGMYIAPDKDGLGADAQITQAALEATDAVKAFRRLVAKLSGGRRFTCKLEG